MKSLMFVPANEKMLSKIGLADSDEYIIDLEDAISPENKSNALILTAKWLGDNSSDNIFVRLNSDNYRDEALLLSKFNTGFMLPKFESVSYYDDYSDIWKKHKVIALIETPKGILNLNEICACEWIFGLAFGAEDYTASVNMKNKNELLLFSKSSIVNCAKAYGKSVYDTPSFNINDMELLKEDIRYSVDLGFDGKLAIHPKQIQPINDLFSDFDIEYMKAVVKEYENSGLAVLTYNGKVYEKMHINRMKRIIKENS